MTRLITPAPRDPRTEGAGRQHWAWVRGPFEADDLESLETVKHCKAWVRYVSARGICVVLSWRPRPHTRLEVELLGANQAVSRPLPVRVRHTRPWSNVGWITGCVFENQPDDEELQAFQNK